MKVGKPTSKRKTVRLRHKIEKASSAKQRKSRKEAKKNPQWRSRLKKDPGIPASFPYKAQILAEIEESKRRKEEEQMQKREMAKARREGKTLEVTTKQNTVDPEELLDVDDDEQEDDTEMDIDDANPMAALLASAQARAQSFGDDETGDLQDEDESDDDDGQWNGLEDTKQSAVQTTNRTLPQRALDDPVKAVNLLLTKLQETNTDIQPMLDYYQLPAIVTAGNDVATRFLVEVARKRGRLGKGGIPNMHAAALIVLTDVHEERLSLPKTIVQQGVPAQKSEVTIVGAMAAPFKLDGLWGGDS